MNLVSWNCRGLGGNQKAEEIKRLKFSEKISILTIQGTKMKEKYNMAILNKIWKNGEGKAVSSQGASGCILTWWDKSLYRLTSASENKH